MRNSSTLALGGVVLDQVLDWSFRHYYPSVVHSQPLVAWNVPTLVVALVGGVVLWWKIPRGRGGVLLVVAGLCSNLLSRLLYGGVTDYLPTGISYTNTADLLVVIGCFLALLELWTLPSSSQSR